MVPQEIDWIPVACCVITASRLSSVKIVHRLGMHSMCCSCSLGYMSTIICRRGRSIICAPFVCRIPRRGFFLLFIRQVHPSNRTRRGDGAFGRDGGDRTAYRSIPLPTVRGSLGWNLRSSPVVPIRTPLSKTADPVPNAEIQQGTGRW